MILLGFYVLYNNLILPPLAALINTMGMNLSWLWRLANGLADPCRRGADHPAGTSSGAGDRRGDDEIVEFKGEEEE